LKGLRFGEAARRIDVTVSGGRILRVEVGFGRNGDVQDRVDLLEPVLIRK